MKLFEEYKIKNLVLKNRLVMPPMCMYQVKNNDGKLEPFHFAHYTQRAIGQVGLIIVESTGVTENGRITDNCLGLWDDSQIEAMKQLVDHVHENGSKIAIQLNHAGRKSETSGLSHIGPSKIEFNDQEINYKEASTDEIEQVINSFADAAKRADLAGFDAIEIHGAHGYLIHQFISPLSNKRDDEYGKDRFLLLKKIVEAIKQVWPQEKPLWLRISATDYTEGGLEVEDWIQFLKENDSLVDLIHVSAGGNVNAKINIYPGYMLDYARRIKEETGYPTIGVGLVNKADLMNFALENNICDLIACGRELLRNPNIFLEIARDRKREDLIPYSYKRAY